MTSECGERRDKAYTGFEQGPIRPPSESFSLLIRVVRNCPWNRCTFCPVYKDTRFSVRPVEDVQRDIDTVYRYVCALDRLAAAPRLEAAEEIRALSLEAGAEDQAAFHAAFQWVFAGGKRSVFLQDANALVAKPPDLMAILHHLKTRFPDIQRITSYARAQTIQHIDIDVLRSLREHGLNRIHIGLESGSDTVLKRVCKGVTKAGHVEAGCRVKEAGIELSEYVMPGLGGQTLSQEHVRETADALNQINPDFIRIRTLAIPPSAPLHAEYAAGRFDKCGEVMMVQELLGLLEGLHGITSEVKSDHILNLFGELAGHLPGDKGENDAAVADVPGFAPPKTNPLPNRPPPGSLHPVYRSGG